MYTTQVSIDNRWSTNSRFFVLMQILFSSLFIALCAQIRIPLPFTPVPLTFQTIAIMLIGGSLGSRKAVLVVLLYIAEALMGLPVLSGGRIDPFVLTSPVAGYVIGFVFLAHCTGRFSESIQNIGQSMLCFYYLLASFMTLICGALWLSLFIGLEEAILIGIVPFIAGDVVKVFIVTEILKFQSLPTRV